MFIEFYLKNQEGSAWSRAIEQICREPSGPFLNDLSPFSRQPNVVTVTFSFDSARLQPKGESS